MKRYIYHYVAQKHEGLCVKTIDGIALMEKKIVTQEDYHRLKQIVSGDTTGFKEWIIKSLSLHGQEN